MGKLGVGMKALWNFLDGWKSWIVAVVAVYKLACHDCAGAGYIDAAQSALGWNSITGAFDPKEALAAIAVIVALGHRLIKAILQYRAGVPIADLHSGS